MAEPKWTPGPWRVRTKDVRQPGCAEIDAAHWWALAEVVVRRETDGPESLEAPHNARLIAAAPELYTALAAVLGWLDDNPTGVGMVTAANHARQVLAKARGETP